MPSARIDYPADKFEIQVLDDSTDETDALARRKVAELRARGLDVVYLHRPHRVGYKAGALEYGLEGREGRARRHLRRRLPPAAGLSARRRRHFQRSAGRHGADALGSPEPRREPAHARAGADARRPSPRREPRALRLRLALQLLRHRRHLARAAIDDAGGWQHDTLTEDLDLSYRAQLAGWRFVYRATSSRPPSCPRT